MKLHFTDHGRRAKRRVLAVQYAKQEGQRKAAYRDLLKLARKTVGYATAAIPLAKNNAGIEALVLGAELERYVGLSRQVIEQTERRVLKGEKLPAAEKIVSIFEPHTDIIVKDRRDTYYGHKVCLSVGASNLITDCVITEGNPADSALTLTMLDRQREIYGRYPLKVSPWMAALLPNPLGGSFLYAGLGSALMNAGRFEEAVSALKKAIQLTPNDILAHLRLAATYSMMGREKEAGAEAAEF